METRPPFSPALCCFLLASLLFFPQRMVGRKNQDVYKHKGSDYYRCVDIHQQRAFKHPKLKNHQLQIVPNIPLPVYEFPLNIPRKYACPKGTVPIQINPLIRPLTDINSGVRNFATISTPQGERTYRGGAAVIEVVKPAVGMGQSSRANIWVQNGPKSSLNSIEAGWAVHPNLYGDNQTRLTAYWTADNFQTTGCYNVLCPGFVQVNSEFFLGQDYHIGIPDETNLTFKYSMPSQTAILQDNVTSNWWLVAEIEAGYTEAVGYWPKEIFTYLSLGADVVKYGGTTSTYIEKLDRPPMGNGFNPSDHIGGAYFMWIHYMNESYKLTSCELGEMNKVLDSVCYGLVTYNLNVKFNMNMRYGGPGGPPDHCNQLSSPVKN